MGIKRQQLVSKEVMALFWSIYTAQIITYFYISHVYQSDNDNCGNATTMIHVIVLVLQICASLIILICVNIHKMTIEMANSAIGRLFVPSVLVCLGSVASDIGLLVYCLVIDYNNDCNASMYLPDGESEYVSFTLHDWMLVGSITH